MLLALLLQLVPPAAASGASDLDSTTFVRVGLAFGSSALASANLENARGSGYRFGYFDESLKFIPLGETEQTKISMLKSRILYLTKDKGYTSSATDYGTVGCFHIQLPGAYTDYEEAKAAADEAGGFVAWISGVYYVRLNSYASRSQANAAVEKYEGATLGETSKYGISVTVTGTTTILFQFDDEGKGTGLGVMPDLMDAEDVQTWFKGLKYRGGFRYQRVDGNDMNVVNVVSLGDYVKGVVPYEMSPSWPLEALKVQAVCARTYVLSNRNKHKSQGFDVCYGIECQVYQGTNRENAVTVASVEETSGVTVKYNGAYANTVFSSSNGGASESSQNVWGGKIAYLQGVVDPYEAFLADKIPNYRWTRTISGKELQSKLIERGYTNCGEIVSVTLRLTELGNVLSMTLVDNKGKSWTVNRESCRIYFSFRSQRFSLADASAETEETSGVLVNGETVPASGLYAIGAGGELTSLGGTYSVITAEGVQTVTAAAETAAPTTTTANAKDGMFTFQGSGYGHNVGMSQWGANAMAQQGFNYVEILTFYYTGVTVGV